jgi:hypothetical protein
LRKRCRSVAASASAVRLGLCVRSSPLACEAMRGGSCGYYRVFAGPRLDGRGASTKGRNTAENRPCSVPTSLKADDGAVWQTQRQRQGPIGDPQTGESIEERARCQIVRSRRIHKHFLAAGPDRLPHGRYTLPQGPQVPPAQVHRPGQLTLASNEVRNPVSDRFSPRYKTRLHRVRHGRRFLYPSLLPLHVVGTTGLRSIRTAAHAETCVDECPDKELVPWRASSSKRRDHVGWPVHAGTCD